MIGVGPGIGVAAAQKWAKEGFHVALLSRTLEKLQAVAAEIPNSKCVCSH